MSAVRLFHRDFGGRGRPVVILHGLFGSHKNWVKVAEELSADAHVYGLDLRNHGDSPHAPSHALSDLVQDLELWISENLSETPLLLAHSMGGLAAMAYALANPHGLSGLLVVDIAPRAYAPRHGSEFAALSVPVGDAASREEIGERMQQHVSDPMTRRFLAMNLERRSTGGYRWKINVPVLERASYIEDFPESQTSWSGPALFLLGGRSDYVRPEDEERIRARFPQAVIERKSDADHWLHYSATDWFLPRARAFVRNPAAARQ